MGFETELRVAFLLNLVEGFHPTIPTQDSGGPGAMRARVDNRDRARSRKMQQGAGRRRQLLRAMLSA
jgi:hypothetical protein